MIEKFVKVNYPEPSSQGLKINYNIQLTGNIQTIECVVDNKEQPLPSWLQLRKFSFISIKTKDIYSLLFNESKYDKNLDTLLFLDEVYAVIMNEGNFRVA